MACSKGAVVAALAVLTVPLAGPAQAASAYGSNAASNTVVAPQVNQVAAQQSASLISGRVSQAVANVSGNIGGNLGSGGTGGGGGGGFGGGSPGAPSQGPRSNIDGSGRAAGNEPLRFGVWSNASYAWLSDSQANANFDAGILDALVGADYMVTDSLLIGLAGGYESSDVKTIFNQGTLKGQGWALAPYGAWVINRNFNIDASFGGARLDYDMTRLNSAVSGHTNGARWFGSINGNANFMLDDHWTVGAALGFLYVKEDQDAYTESDGSPVGKTKTRLGQMRATPKLGYRIATPFGSVTPYGSARLEYDVSKSPAQVIDGMGTLASNGRFGTTFAVGVNADVGDAVSVNIEASSAQFRKDIESTVLGGTVRYKF